MESCYPPADPLSYISPETEMLETPDDVWIRVVLPGLDPAALRIAISEWSATVTASTTPHSPDPASLTGAHPVSEPTSRAGIASPLLPPSFRLDCHLPSAIDVSHGSATLCNGLLELRLPKQIPLQRACARRVSGPAIEREISARVVSAVPPPHPVRAREGEGAPSVKLGTAYIPSGSEDHADRSRSVAGRRGERPPDPVAAGSTNPLETDLAPLDSPSRNVP